MAGLAGFSAATHGIDVSLELAIPVWKGLEIRANLQYRRYFMSENAGRNEVSLAAGANDQYLSPMLGIAVRR